MSWNRLSCTLKTVFQLVPKQFIHIVAVRTTNICPQTQNLYFREQLQYSLQKHRYRSDNWRE